MPHLRPTAIVASLLVSLAGSALIADRSWAPSFLSSKGELASADQPTTPPEPSQKEPRRGKGGGGGGGRGEGGRGGQGQGQGDQPGSLMQRMSAFQTDVPAHDLDVVLTRPTPRSVTVSLMAASDREAKVEYGPQAGGVRTSPSISLTKSRTGLIELEGLSPDTAYAYRVISTVSGSQTKSDEFRFTTPPEKGSVRPFTFVIQADSHLDSNMDPLVYAQSLRNMLADKPAFLMDLGDTFMTDKRRDFKETLHHYDAQRYYFGLLCHSAPLFMVLGNHDGETGATNPNQQGMPTWSYEMRTSRFPAPRVGDGADSWYTGRTALKEGKGGNYYAFEWGDALFIALDPFWNTTERPRGGGGGRGGSGGSGPGEPNANTDQNWSKTLGREQFDWLEGTLTSSKAKHRFVFIHHLVGGLGKDSRGGMEASVFFEWGGRNADGSPGFAERRKGWSMPIHDLLVKHGVEAVFHGHDHLFVRNERDGLVYQCVPQPGNSQGGTRSAKDYGYLSGTILASPGYLRVSVDDTAAKVELIRSALPEGQGRRQEREPNGAVVHAYELKPRVNQTSDK